jgi:hypothetical protein
MRGLGTSLLAALLAVGLAACDKDGFADQGFSIDPNHRSERWIQLDPEPVDVLWVVDTSGSMLDEQAKLAENFPAFIRFFVDEALMFRIGVTSTNVFEEETEGLDGRLNGDPPWLEPDTPGLEDAFVERAYMGIDDHHSDEKGLHASWTALEELGDSDNAGFIREEANLAVVVLSDEPDYSEVGDAGSDAVIGWEEYAAWLDDFKGDPTRTQLSALVGISEDGPEDPDGCEHEDLPPDDQSGWGYGAARGDGYLEAALATDGAAHSICKAEWAGILNHLGLAAAGLMTRFVLTEVPDVGTIRVTVGGINESSWVFDEPTNAVVFVDYDAVPRAGESVLIQYRIADAEQVGSDPDT